MSNNDFSIKKPATDTTALTSDLAGNRVALNKPGVSVPNISPEAGAPDLNSWQNLNHQDQPNQSSHRSSTTANTYQSPTANLEHNGQAHDQVTNNSKWYQLSGRIGRLRYLGYQMLMTVLMYIVITAVALIGFGVLTEFTNETTSTGGFYFLMLLIALPLLFLVFYSGIIYPKRRLHDLNLSGWLVLLMFIPLVNTLFPLYLMFAAGNDRVNQYGNPPRPNRTIHYVGVIAPIVGIFMLGILAAIAIPAYQDYVQRAQQAQIE